MSTIKEKKIIDDLHKPTRVRQGHEWDAVPIEIKARLYPEKYKVPNEDKEPRESIMRQHLKYLLNKMEEESEKD